MKHYLPILAASLLLSACAGTQDMVSKLNPFKIDIRQGNYVSQEMVAQLKPGQTKDQVRFILGTPLITDVFHADRWDYVYRFQPGRGEAQQRRLIVFFDDNKLLRVAGDVVANDPSTDVQDAKPSVRTMEILDPTAPVTPAASPSTEKPAAEPADKK
ncbi:MAG TPA: outer membrane protein assembly factor BamE [Rhodocyclaceae bacterium]|nr:outer membrane protein assembly factor BamE [Rhodocyclaceae bacterium]